MAIKLISKDATAVFIPESERGEKKPFKVETRIMTYGQYTKFIDSMPVRMRKRKTSTESAAAIAALLADRVKKISNYIDAQGKISQTEDPKEIRDIYHKLPPDMATNGTSG